MTSRTDDPFQNEGARPNPPSARALIERPELLPSTHVAHETRAHMEDEDTINLREYWAVIAKRKWTVITFFLITVVSVITATFLMTKIYRASLTLQIERQETKVVEYQGVMPNEMQSDTKDFYQTQYELLKSRTMAQRVIDQLNLADHPLFKRKREEGFFNEFLERIGVRESALMGSEEAITEARLIAKFLKQLTVEPVRNSRLVKIHFDSPDPQLAARITNTMSGVFINLNLERRMDASSYAKTFLQDRLQQIKVKLEDSEKALNAFAREEGIVRADEKLVSPDAQALTEFTTALARAQQERIKAETLHRQTESATTGGLSSILENRVIQEYKARKAKLETDYQEGLKIYKPAYPKMLQIESQIAEMEAKIAEEITSVRAAVKANYEVAQSQEDLLSAKLKESKKMVLGLQDRSIHYNVLKRDVDTNRELYEGLLQRLKEVGVAGGIGVNNISIVDKAEAPSRPFKPQLGMNAMIAVFLGLFGGIGLAFLFEHLDDTLKRPDDLERRLGLAVLGVIPRVRQASAGQDIAMTENADPRSGFAEAYRSVRTALQFSTQEGAPKVLMITSASVEEGKSTTAISLAMQFAQAGKTVLLIDADLRKASLHKKLKLDNALGLTNYLAGDAKPVQITNSCHVPKLFVISSGPLPPNPAELISSAKMVSLLSLAAEKFDQVIIDGPPVLGLADAPLLGSIADATVMVVEAGTTSWQLARTAVKRLRGTRTRMIGGILTKMSAHGRAYGYYQSYYYQYGGSETQGSERLPA